jgi:hypothetical protein
VDTAEDCNAWQTVLIFEDTRVKRVTDMEPERPEWRLVLLLEKMCLKLLARLKKKTQDGLQTAKTQRLP